MFESEVGGVCLQANHPLEGEALAACKSQSITKPEAPGSLLVGEPEPAGEVNHFRCNLGHLIEQPFFAQPPSPDELEPWPELHILRLIATSGRRRGFHKNSLGWALPLCKLLHIFLPVPELVDSDSS